jgi:hypothetical protein
MTAEHSPPKLIALKLILNVHSPVAWNTKIIWRTTIPQKTPMQTRSLSSIHVEDTPIGLANLDVEIPSDGIGRERGTLDELHSAFQSRLKWSLRWMAEMSGQNLKTQALSKFFAAHHTVL